MFVVALAVTTLVVGTLYTVTGRARLLPDNRERMFEGLRLIGHIIVWGIIASHVIGLLLPSAWS